MPCSDTIPEGLYVHYMLCEFELYRTCDCDRLAPLKSKGTSANSIGTVCEADMVNMLYVARVSCRRRLHDIHYVLVCETSTFVADFSTKARR